MDLDAPFDLATSAAPITARGRSEQLRRFAGQILQASECAVVVVVDLSTREAIPVVAGHAPAPRPEQEALLTLWLQHGDATALRSVPTKLRELLPAEKALVMPLLTPGGALGVIALSPPCLSRRVLRRVEALAEDFAMQLEETEREPVSRRLHLEGIGGSAIDAA
ncbi:MAG: GAF domain-containing protein [Polyangiaceae bacterium]